MSGWIKLHRKLLNHWIVKDDSKFAAWIKILLEVNHSSEKVLIDNKLYDCNPGERLYSLDTWSRKFGRGWNKSKVRRFFNLLQNDSMIVTESLRKTTRLTVCKYESYQHERNADETQMKRKRNADETPATPIKNDKKEKKVKNEKNNTCRNYDDYKKLEQEAFDKIINDKTFIDEIKEDYPDLDPVKTLKKAHIYWKSEDGFNKKNGSSKINWKSTYKKACGMSWNQVEDRLSFLGD